MKYTQYVRGTNQYKKKEKLVILQWFIVFMIILDLCLGFRWLTLHYKNTGIEQAWAQEAIVSPIAKEVTPTPTLTPEQKATQEEIENYIRTIFGKDAKVAIAVSHNECGPTNKMYPYKCRFTTNQEDSIGIFQINLQSATTKVHFHRVPGETLEEKVAWLSDPYNNTLMAYWIFSKSGWNPWSAYTSGRYLKDM